MKLALFGHGGHAIEAAWQIQTSLKEKITFFVDDDYYNSNYEDVLPISSFNPKKWTMMIAIADPQIRCKIEQKLPKETKYFTFIHPKAQIGYNTIIDKGSFIGTNSILTCNIRIGKHTILNRGNHIGHDCIIGDYFSAMPGSIISGNVTIGYKVYLGTNSSIKEQIKITNNVTVGMGSVVVKDITQPGVYVGMPANKIK